MLNPMRKVPMYNVGTLKMWAMVMASLTKPSPAKTINDRPIMKKKDGYKISVLILESYSFFFFSQSGFYFLV